MPKINELISDIGDGRPRIAPAVDAVLNAALPEEYSDLVGLGIDEFRQKVGDKDLAELTAQAEANANNPEYYEPGSNSSQAVLRMVAAVRRDLLN